ncbi:unnamed protein product, partial [Discosporangium mesarthrocarpum]
MYVYGCPKVLGLDPREGPEDALALAFNPGGSLLAVATTAHLCIWSGGKDHVLLGSVELRLRELPSTRSVLWRRDSSIVAAVSDLGRLVLASVKRCPGAKPVAERFSVPTWIEQQHPVEDAEGGDPWSNPTEVNVGLVAEVAEIDSSITAMCQGRFGQDILAGTANGKIYGVSWQGTVLCQYGIVSMLHPSSMGGASGGGGGGGLPGGGEGEGHQGPVDSEMPSGFGGAAMSSMSFHDTLQLLALTTGDGGFYLGTLSKGNCYVRPIAITEQAHECRHSMASAGQDSPRPAPPPARKVRTTRLEDKGWGWGLGWWLGTGKGDVAAAPEPSSSPQPWDLAAQGSSGTAPECRASSGEGMEPVGNAAAGAVSVVFSERGCLMAVSLMDGSVLLTRVDRYTSGVRAHHQLQILGGRPQRSGSFKLESGRDARVLAAGVGAGGTGASSNDGGVSMCPRRVPAALMRKESMSSLWGVEIHHLHCLSLHHWLQSEGEGVGVGVAGSGKNETKQVVSMCFSFDGRGLAVGHEGAITIWSTADGTRLVCSLSHGNNNGGRYCPPGSPIPGPGVAPSPMGSGALSWSSTLDLVAGGARSLTWGWEGYRLLSLGAATGATGGGEGAGGEKG